MADSSEYLDRLLSITAKMSTWIAEELWDGHEKHCAQYAGGPGPCDCIQTVRDEWHKLDRQMEFDPPTNINLLPRMMDMQALITAQDHDLKCAREAIRYFRDQLRDLGAPAESPDPKRFGAWYDETAND